MMRKEIIVDQRDVRTARDLVFAELGLAAENSGACCGQWLDGNDPLPSRSPIDGSLLAAVRGAGEKEYEAVMEAAHEAFRSRRRVPAPMHSARAGHPVH